jgi:hypothetical protein
VLGDAVADVRPGMPRRGRRDEALGRVHTGDLGLAISGGELLDECARAAADVQRAAGAGEARAVDEECGEGS